MVVRPFMQQVIARGTNLLLIRYYSMRNIVAAAVDRAIHTYTLMGLRGDEEWRGLLREAARQHIEGLTEQGQHDEDRLVVSTLKHLVSLEDRPLSRRGNF
jgi:hypothetical protein